ncbi:MAG: N utilization substance protein B, partial [Clostridia bacterium]|nr:N utilization substance protein B [Clostridia bacterium]
MSRRVARDIAFRALFQIDIGKCRAEQALKHSLKGFSLSSTEEEFVYDLVTGTVDNGLFLDELI